jgi:hypothetical protein
LHDSEPAWVASPSPYETFIHNTLPVLTGAPKIETISNDQKIGKLQTSEFRIWIFSDLFRLAWRQSLGDLSVVEALRKISVRPNLQT